MINKKITLSALSIVTALALTAGATYAFFTDQATSTGNTFSTGNANLQIGQDTGDENTVAFGDSYLAPDYSDLTPGFTSNSDFWLRNTSSGTISLNILADLTVTAETPGSDATDNLKDNLLISWNCDTDDDGSLGNNTPSSEFSVNQWATGGNADLGTIAPNNAIFCRMTARVPSSATNEIAGDSLSFDGLFDATQL